MTEDEHGNVRVHLRHLLGHPLLSVARRTDDDRLHVARSPSQRVGECLLANYILDLLLSELITEATVDLGRHLEEQDTSHHFLNLQGSEAPTGRVRSKCGASLSWETLGERPGRP